MNNTVVIHLGGGDLYAGFPQVTARLWDERQDRVAQFVGSLPPVPALVEQYRQWQATYDAVCHRQVLRANYDETADHDLEIEETGITQVSQVSLKTLSQQFQQQFNLWLQSEGFAEIERQLRSHLDPDTELRIMLETTDDSLRRLPWHGWELLRDYPHAEIALSRPDYQYREVSRSREPGSKVRILAVLGDRRGIDIHRERQFLASLPDAETEFLVTPTRQVLSDRLWDAQGWDILFFAGHSQTEADTGRLYINENPVHNSLTIEQLAEALRAAIDRGLKLAIFNSCDGIGLAQALGRLHIPQVVVMREPVPNRVAQEFLRYFLDAYALERLPLYRAVRQARRKLQGLEDDFPGASWLPVICQNPAVATPTWLQLGGMPPCPYRGLFAFQEADAPLFFGREQATQTLVTAVKKQALVAVVGSSGSGKSSVVFAGLVPKLRAIAHRSTPLHIAAFRPGPNPFDALAESLAKLLLATDSPTSGDTANTVQSLRFKTLELSVEFQHNSHALYSRMDGLIRQHPDARLILIADQFEELYTLCPEADRQLFLDSLLNAVQFSPAFTLVLTLRADFYGHALSDRRFSDLLQGAVYNLGPMSQAELQAAIAQPAAQMQVQFEPGLTDQLAEATSGHAGRLPLLEFALTRLWPRQQEGWLTHEAYREIGGVEEAIATHAEGVFAQLNPYDRTAVQRVFVQLVELGVGTEPSRRLATRDEVGEENWSLVSHLASERLVMTNRHEVTGEETVEIIHEALLYNWKRLERWIREDEEFRRWQEDLRGMGRRWEKSGSEPEALLRGKLLSDAKYWYDLRYQELSSRERQFIELSVADQEREQKSRRRRRKTVTLGLSVGLVAALMLAGGALWQWQQATLSDIRSNRVASEALLMSNQRLDALVQAVKAWRSLSTLFPPNPEEQTRAQVNLEKAVYSVVEENYLSGRHNGELWAVAFSPDGKLIATASEDTTVNLWSRDGRWQSSLQGHTAGVRQVAFSPDGKRVATIGDQTIKLWDLTGNLQRTFPADNGLVNGVAFSPDGAAIAAVYNDGSVILWAITGEQIKRVQAHSAPAWGVAFSPDGAFFATASEDKTAKIWRRDGTPLKALTNHEAAVWKVAFSPNGKMIATASADETVRVWQTDGTPIHVLSGHTNSVWDIAFSPDSQTLASSSWDNTVKLWSLDPISQVNNGRLITTLKGHLSRVRGIAFSPDGQVLASASEDKTAKLWRLNHPLLTPLNGHQMPVLSVAFNSGDQSFVSVGDDNTIRVWDQTGRLLRTQAIGGGMSIALSPDHHAFAVANWGGSIERWDRNQPQEPLQHQLGVWEVTFSPDNRWIASASVDGTVRLWTRAGKFQKMLPHNGEAKSVAFSPDSQLIATGSLDQNVRLWKLDGTLVQKFEVSSGVNRVRFSPDGKEIASANADGTVTRWTIDGKPLKPLIGHTEAIRGLSFSPNGDWIATAGVDHTVRIWSRKGELLRTLRRHIGAVWAVEFSLDSHVLASASEDTTVVLWNVDRILATDPTAFSCIWIRDYLRTNRVVSDRDRRLCD